MTDYKTGVVVSGDATGAVRSLKLTRDQLDKLNRKKREGAGAANAYSASIGKMSGLLKTLVPVVTIATVANLTRETLNSADSIGKLSTRIGASTEALSEYRHVAELSGVKFNQLTTAWQRQTRRIAEAAQGTGEAKKALKELGLEAGVLAKLSPEEQFESIAQAMEGVSNQADRVRLGMKFWDSEGVSMLQTMSGGVETIREMRLEAQELGMSLSGDQVAAAEAANDAFTRLSNSAAGLRDQLVLGLAPGIAQVVEKFNELLRTQNIFTAIGGSIYEAFKIMLHGVAPEISATEQEILRLEESIRDMQPHIENTAGTMERLEKAGMKGSLAWKTNSDILKNYKKIISDAEKRIDELTKATDKSTSKVDKNTKATDENTKSRKDNADAAGDQVAAMESVIFSLDKELAAQYEHSRTLDELHSLYVQGLIPSQEEYNRLLGLAEEKYSSNTDEVRKLKSETKSASIEVRAFASEWSSLGSEVDSAFVQLWKDGLDGFENFRDSLFDAFDDLLAELAHEALTRPILVQMGVAGGRGSSAAAGVAYNSATGEYDWSGYMASPIDMSQGSSEGAAGFSMTENTMGAGGYGIAGALGGMFGAQAFEGEHASSGASIGATIGMAWGPIGAIVGAVIGGFVGDKWSDHAEARYFNDADGIAPPSNAQRYGDPSRGNRYRPWEDDVYSEGAFGTLGLSNMGSKDIDAAQFQQAIEQITAIDDAIADAFGPEATRRVREALDGWTRDDGDGGGNFDEVMADRLEVIIDNLDFQWTEFVRMGTDTVDELVERLSHLKEAEDFIESSALEGYTDLLAQSQMTLRDQLEASVSSVARLGSELSTFHGSTESMEALAVGLRERYELEIQYLNQIRTIQEGLNTSIQSSIETIQLSVMDTEQQYDYFTDRAEALAATIDGLSDPTEINDVVNQINELTNRAYGTLNQDQREDVSDGFIDFLEGVLETANNQLDEARSDAVDQSEMLRTRIEQAINDAMVASARHFERAAAEQLAAAQLFADGANIDVNLNWNHNYDAGYLNEAGYY